MLNSHFGRLCSAFALAALAITFVACEKHDEAVEARQMLDLIKKGSAAYYSSPRVEAGTGRQVECQFPASTGLTPALVNGKHPCCAGGDKASCAAAPDNWNNPTWSALMFQLNSNHYYAYKYESSGVYGAAKFTATAYGDLDCDGNWSTFVLNGQSEPTANAAQCDMASGGKVEETNHEE